jgi:tRNA dimethylallyltransferase
VGYRELIPLAAAAEDVDPGRLAEAVERIKTSTRRYAKRQVTWFSQLPGIRWFDVDELGVKDAAQSIVASWRAAGR